MVDEKQRHWDMDAPPVQAPIADPRPDSLSRDKSVPRSEVV
jgi:hypothetical protein